MQFNEIDSAELAKMREKTAGIVQKFSAEYDPALVKLFNAELDRIHGKKSN